MCTAAVDGDKIIKAVSGLYNGEDIQSIDCYSGGVGYQCEAARPREQAIPHNHQRACSVETQTSQ